MSNAGEHWKFQPGHTLSKHKGRPKGSVNKRTAEFARILEERGMNPAEAIADMYELALSKFTAEVELETAGTISRMESNAVKYLKIAADMACEAASYTTPKLKAVEHVKEDPLGDMSPSEKLEAMRAAVKLMDAQIKAGK